MSTRTLRKISGLVAAAAVVAAIGVPSAGAVKPEGTPGGGNGKSKANAARICKAERADIGVDAFREQYGTNKNGKNAFGKCVASKRKQAQQEEPTAV